VKERAQLSRLERHHRKPLPESPPPLKRNRCCSGSSRHMVR
jgi:hypothetical protein